LRNKNGVKRSLGSHKIPRKYTKRPEEASRFLLPRPSRWDHGSRRRLLGPASVWIATRTRARSFLITANVFFRETARYVGVSVLKQARLCPAELLA
jgi:hypothetical protein